METKYFICTSPRQNGTHIIHRENCPLLPGPEKRIFLGIFQSFSGAIKEGRKYFNLPGKCIYCSKEHSMKNKTEVFCEIMDDTYLISHKQLKIDIDDTFRCSVN